MALKKSIEPAGGKSGNFAEDKQLSQDKKWGHKLHTGVPVPEKKTPAEMMSSGSGNLTSGTRLTVEDVMRGEQQCITINQSESGAEGLSSLNKDCEGSSYNRARRGAGGGAGGWALGLFRRRPDRAEEKTKSNQPDQGRQSNSSSDSKERSNAEEFFKEMADHLDQISFWLFLTVWLIVTMSYMIALFT